MNEFKPPILLIGNVRSGTTMMQDTLEQGGDVVQWFEPRTTWTVGNVEKGHDRFTADMATPKTIRRIHEMFQKYYDSNGGRRIVEKTPSNVLRIPFIHKVFPESKILHIYRDARDNVSSCLPRWGWPMGAPALKKRMRETPILEWPKYFPRFVRDHLGIRLGLTKRVKSWGVVYPGMYEDLKRMDLVEVIATQWVKTLEVAQADLKELDPDIWIEVKYEDLVANPLEGFGRIVDFFDLEMSPALEKYIRENIHQNVVSVYKKRLTPDQIAKIDPIVRPMMERLGYDM